MLNFLKKEINLSFLINPFYIYCATFSLSIFIYSWGWSSIYPEISYSLIFFLLCTFSISVILGRVFSRCQNFSSGKERRFRNHYLLLDIIFYLIIFLGILDVSLTGYVPFLDRSRNHLEFGFPVLDPIFNSLSIFFSVFFFQTFLESRRKRYIIYLLIIIVLQLFIFRRSTVIWILTASTFLFIRYRKQIRAIVLLSSLLFIPLISYGFGLYGNVRNDLGKSYIMNELGPSEYFKSSGINSNHYLTYLYLSSPLANLQNTINQENGFTNDGELKDFLFYSILPQSLTKRIERPLKLSAPEYNLIHPHLIVGTFLFLSFSSLGWLGMILMILYLIIYIITCLVVIRRWDSFSMTTYSILVTTVALLTFANFLNRLDVMLTLFVYPVVFHYVFRFAGNELSEPLISK